MLKIRKISCLFSSFLFVVFTTWNYPIDAGYFDQSSNPLTVTDSVGNRAAVWIAMEGTDGTEYNVLASLTPAGEEGWAQPEKISANFDHFPLSLKISKNNSDGILVTWIDRHPETKCNCLCASILKSGEAKWETAMISSRDEFVNEDYSVSMDDANNIDLVWTSRISEKKTVVRHTQTKLGSNSWSIPQTITSL